MSERTQPIVAPPTRGGIIKCGETENIAARLTTLTKKVSNLLTERLELVNAMEIIQEVCDI